MHKNYAKHEKSLQFRAHVYIYMLMQTHEKIKQWLKDNDTNRAELAAAVGVAKRTVDNWLSGAQPIPERKLALINEMMEDGEKTSLVVNINSVEVIVIRVTPDELAQIAAAAAAARMTLENWCRMVLLARTGEILASSRGA